MRDDGVHRAHREVCREDEEHDADCAFGEPLDALRSMRLTDLGPELPDEDDRGGRVDRRVESEAEQRQAAGRQPDDHSGATEQTGEHDAQDGKTEGSMEQVMAVHRESQAYDMPGVGIPMMEAVTSVSPWPPVVPIRTTPCG